MKFGTRLIHNERSMDKKTGALSIPIYQVSTYHQHDLDAGQEFMYSRSENPTRRALEETIAMLEGADAGYAFSSGMAATSSALSIFSAGDHIIICEDVYGGTYRIASTFFSRFGFEISFVDTSDPDNIRKAIKSNTKALFLETPSNPTLKITDLREACSIARQNGMLVLVDNTFMSPYLQRPIELGADVVIHSATKFIGGHSDVIGGLIAVKGKELAKRIYAVQNGFGAILGPQDSWLLLRGLKTLKVRLDYQQKNAQGMAEWLNENKRVSRVYYPALSSHPGAALHASQSDGSGAVLAFDAADTAAARAFMSRMTCASVAVSLGGVETIVSYPYKMSHAAMPKAERERLGISDCLIRISAGLEDIDDLLENFKAAIGS